MVQALFLAGRTRIKAANLANEIVNFLQIAQLPPTGAVMVNDFFFCPFGYELGPARFKYEFREALSSGLFIDYGIGRIIGEPYTLDDLVPSYESLCRARANLDDENTTWTERLKSLGRDCGHDPFGRPTHLKLLLVHMQAGGLIDDAAVKTLKKRLGPKARYHWHTPEVFFGSVHYAASPESLCKALTDVLVSDAVIDFAVFDIGAEYVSALGGLNSLEHWINQTLSVSAASPPRPVAAKQQFMVERKRRRSRIK
jgi:hypothetical protein